MAYRTCKEEGSGQGTMTPGAVISGWFSWWIFVARVYTDVEDTWYLSTFMLRKAIRNLRFDPPKPGDPQPTSELIALLYHALPLQSPSLRCCGILVAAQ